MWFGSGSAVLGTRERLTQRRDCASPLKKFLGNMKTFLSNRGATRLNLYSAAVQLLSFYGSYVQLST